MTEPAANGISVSLKKPIPQEREDFNIGNSAGICRAPFLVRGA